MALKVLSNIEVPTPTTSDTKQATNVDYVERNGGGSVAEATTESPGTVTLADPSAGVSANEGKVPVLDEFGKLNQGYLPTAVVNGATGAKVTSLGGQQGAIDVDSQFFSVQGPVYPNNAKLTLLYDSRYISYEPGLGLSVSAGVRTAVSNASHLYHLDGSNANDDGSYVSYDAQYTYYSPDVSVPWYFGGEELSEKSYLVCQESLAPVYTAQTYTVGQVVCYGGWIYRCLSSTSTFDTENDYDNWERVTLSDGWGRSNLSHTKQILSVHDSSTQPLTLKDGLDGALVVVDSGHNSRTILLSSLASDLSENEIGTYEIMVRCASGNTTPKIHFRLTSNGSDITFLGENPGDGLERGHTHFIVLRNFPYGTQTVNGQTEPLRQWVGNIQGKVPIPTS